MNQSSAQLDVLILGGGWVGLSFALMLPVHWRIGIIDSLPVARLTTQIDERTLVLAGSSQRIFAALQLWPELAPTATPIHAVHISNEGYFAACRLVAKQLGLEALGYTLAAQTLTQLLHTRLRERTSLTWYAPARVVGVALGEHKAQVTIVSEESSQTLTASLLVGADGAHSQLREQLQVPVKTYDYGQTALVANVQFNRPHHHWAYERFTALGPLALLPRATHQAGLVWCVPTHQAQEMVQWPDATFLTALQQTVGYRLGRLLHITPRASFPIHSVQAGQTVQPNAVLLGSAAYHLHPIGAQSFNLALRDTAALAELLVQAQQQGEALGSWQVLRRYESARQPEQKRLARLTDNAARLLSTTFLPVQALRALGLLALDILPGIKRPFVRQAVGLGGQASKLVCGLPLE